MRDIYERGLFVAGDLIELRVLVDLPVDMRDGLRLNVGSSFVFCGDLSCISCLTRPLCWSGNGWIISKRASIDDSRVNSDNMRWKKNRSRSCMDSCDSSFTCSSTLERIMRFSDETLPIAI